MTLTPARGLAWAALWFALFVAPFLAIFPILAALRVVDEVPHLAQMVLWSLSWGILSMLGVLIAAQLACGGSTRWSRLALSSDARWIGLKACPDSGRTFTLSVCNGQDEAIPARWTRGRWSP